MLSRTAEYALRAVVCLTRSPATAMTAQHIASEMSLPAEYLSKVLQSLGRAGIVRSQRGPSGGFCLAVPAAELSLLKVIDAVDPIRLFESCPIGLEEHKGALCPLHRKLNLAAGALEECLRETSLADLILEETQEASARNGTTVDLGCSAKTVSTSKSSPAKAPPPDDRPKRYDAQEPAS